MSTQQMNATADPAHSHYDVVIIGGGLVGASLACVLGEQNISVAVIEAYPLNTQQQPCYDDRTVALSWGSRQILESMGLWSAIQSQAEPIAHIHISDRGHFGVSRLHADEEKVEALGYVAENRFLGEKLYQKIATLKTVQLYCPASLLFEDPLLEERYPLEEKDNRVYLTLETETGRKTLDARVLVAADGQHSQVKQQLNIGDSCQDYQQTALVTNITPGLPHHNVAYERFTENGPVAFLPMRDNRCSLVWTMTDKQAKYISSLADADFLQQLQQVFGFRLGEFKKVGKRQLYPLILQEATRFVHGRVVIVGNAAHTLHPVAGQGFNLALRDIALLAELLCDAHRHHKDMGASVVLDRYVALREKDIHRVYRFTDTLVKVFSTSFAPLAHCRSAGLQLVDIMPPLKHVLARQSMGLSGRRSRLARGLSL